LPAPADVVLANILSNPLKLLAPLLASLVAPGGAIVLSGVLERQIDEVAQYYASSVPVLPWRIREGWACLVGERAAKANEGYEEAQGAQ
jgi:ribosomal protein L11 methyltransferase